MRFTQCLTLLAAMAVASAAPAYAADTTPVEMKGFVLHVPATWTKMDPENAMRIGQFKLPSAEGDNDITELTVFPPFGGSVDENLKRWEGQVTGGQKKLSKGKTSDGQTYYMMDLEGTYKKPDGPPMLRKTVDKPDYRMLAVIVETPNGNYFLKVTGPKKSVEAQIEPFRQSFKGDSAKEEAYEIK